MCSFSKFLIFLPHFKLLFTFLAKHISIILYFGSVFPRGPYTKHLSPGRKSGQPLLDPLVLPPCGCLLNNDYFIPRFHPLDVEERSPECQL